ncbi:MAG: helix-turn-helix domain-containing protein [Cloacibacterium caeni]
MFTIVFTYVNYNYYICNMNINERFTKILEYSGFTASEFADEIDVQRSSISHIISGRNKPSLEFIVKIKNRFPEISWDWIILGQGEMLQNNSALSNSESKINLEEENSTPDLFTLIDEDYKNEVFVQENIQNETLRESNTSFPTPKKEKISDSQRLDIKENISEVQSIVNETVTNINTESKIKRIVFFYENGKFEAFEP